MIRCSPIYNTWLRAPLKGIFIFVFFIFFSQNIFAQGGHIQIDNSDLLTTVPQNGKMVKLLKGNVQFHQQDVIMNCDSAYLYSEENTMKAYGHVHIKQGDSMNLYGETLDYNGNERKAIMQKNVILLSGKMRLVTDRLDYDMNLKQAYYSNSAVITDEDNRLVSRKGYFYSAKRDMYFKKDVVLTNPDYKMYCDTLQYNLHNHHAIFHGPTTIISKKDTVYCENGWYNTLTGEAHFGKNAHVISGGQVLYGDSIIYDRKKAIGKALGNVKIVDTAEKLTITGDISEHFNAVKRTYITGHVLARKEMENDTLYMTSDSLWSEYDKTGAYRILKGHRHAKIFSREFQGKCDSIKYSFVDSTIDMRVDPIFWFSGYQATAEHVIIYTKRNRLYRANMYKSSFLLMPEDSERYSQVKGRDMVGYFKNNELNVVTVNGNGESIYYVRDEKKAYIGANKILSSNIKINVLERKIQRINFIKDPDAKLIPILKADPRDLLLPGFKFRGAERPKSVEDIINVQPK